jgi:hypothetical protein
MSISGNPIIKLRCGHTIDWGFVYDVEDWADKFKEQEITCPDCSDKGQYSRENLVLIPAKNPSKK